LGAISLFFYQFFGIFRISFFQPGSLNSAVRSKLTLLHTVAIFTKSGKMKVAGTKNSCTYIYNSKDKNLMDNSTLILPALVNMATVCSGVISDLPKPFIILGQKKLILKI
jgi:hypothetical protein